MRQISLEVENDIMHSTSRCTKCAAIAALFLLTFGLRGAEPTSRQVQSGPISESIDLWTMPPDTVVAKVDGEPVTAGHLVQYLQATPERLRPKSASELKRLIEPLGLDRRLARQAVTVGLDKQQPYSTALSIARTQLLAKAQLELMRTKMPVSDGEAHGWYAKHRPTYTSADVQIAFVRDGASQPSDGRRSRTKAQVEAAAARLVTAARAGRRFAGLIDAISDDHPLVTRKGTFRTFNATDDLPDQLKRAIARRKPGEVVGPFPGAGGLFVCRIVGIKSKPFTAVREQVIEEIREAKLKDWVESQKRTVEIRELSK